MKWYNLGDLPGNQEIMFPQNNSIINNKINNINN